MQVVLLRVGIDTGCGGINGPFFADGSFEFIPIPDRYAGKGVNRRTYGNTNGRIGRKLIEYFPESRRAEMSSQSVHFDPEFETFTYGDPTTPKRGLSKMSPGDLLVFYAGLRGWGDSKTEAALYIIGYFEIDRAGFASSFSQLELKGLFAHNFHVKHRQVFVDQKERLVLIKGTAKSRLLNKAVKISINGADKSGRHLHRLSPGMQKVFGNFGGSTSIQRCPPRRVASDFVPKAAKFVFALR